MCCFYADGLFWMARQATGPDDGRNRWRRRLVRGEMEIWKYGQEGKWEAGLVAAGWAAVFLSLLICFSGGLVPPCREHT